MTNKKPIQRLPKNARQIKTRQQLEQPKISHCLLFPAGSRQLVTVTFPEWPELNDWVPPSLS